MAAGNTQRNENMGLDLIEFVMEFTTPARKSAFFISFFYFLFIFFFWQSMNRLNAKHVAQTIPFITLVAIRAHNVNLTLNLHSNALTNITRRLTG